MCVLEGEPTAGRQQRQSRCRAAPASLLPPFSCVGRPFLQNAAPLVPAHLGMATLLPGVVAPLSACSVSVPSAMSCDPALPRICSSGLPGFAAATAGRGGVGTTARSMPQRCCQGGAAAQAGQTTPTGRAAGTHGQLRGRLRQAATLTVLLALVRQVKVVDGNGGGAGAGVVKQRLQLLAQRGLAAALGRRQGGAAGVRGLGGWR